MLANTIKQERGPLATAEWASVNAVIRLAERRKDMLKITAFNTYSETKLYLPCPNCGKNVELGLLAFIDAINRNKGVWCAPCQSGFDIVLTCQTRAAELLRAADQHEQKCPSCEGRGWNFVHGTTDKKVCSRCNGTGISNRSVGA